MLLQNYSTLVDLFSFTKYFIRNSQTIHLYCFSQYQNILIVDLSTSNIYTLEINIIAPKCLILKRTWD